MSLAAFAVVAISFIATLQIMNYFAPLCPAGASLALKKPFQKSGNSFAYSIALPQLDELADTPDAPMRSQIAVCENDYLLRPAHSVHAEIGKTGLGRFSHWKDIGILFSTSDNSDPNVNGRNYRAVQPR
jgi:hypothetical protein